MDKKIFKADKVSGLEGDIFLISFGVLALFESDKQHKFKFSFWAASLDVLSRKIDEWNKRDSYEKKTDKVLASVRKEGALYFENLKRRLLKDSEVFKAEASNLIKQITSLSDKELVFAFEKFVSQYAFYFGSGAITFIYESIVSERLHSYLSRFENTIDIIHVALSTGYKSFINQSEDELLLIKKEKRLSKKVSLINHYLKNYFFMDSGGFSYVPVLDSKAVASLTKKVKMHPNNLSKLIRLNNIKFTPQEKSMIELLQPTEAVHDLRKKINLIGAYTMSRFLDEAIKRRNLEKELALRAFWTEYGDLISDTQNIIKKLKKRVKATLVYENGKSYYLDYLAISERHGKKNIKKICKGTPASRGQVTGVAKIVFGPSGFSKFNKGDILITEMTRPDFVMLMKKSAAIVTDEGGLTSHAAIVSRELGIPCIVGTKIATKVLKDGDEVEVNADNGTVKILKRAN